MKRAGVATILALLASSPVLPGATVSGKIVLLRDGQELPDASNTVVWIEGAHGARKAASGTMKSADKRFQPRVVVVPVRSAVEFPNADPIYHNVFSVSGANRFDLGLYRSGASKSRNFEEPGLVRVYCNIHPQMVGFVMVVDSDFAAVTAPDGAFRLDDVPPGTWTLKVWHEEGAEASQPVTVRAGADATATLRLDITGFKPAPHKNKYGKDYKPPPPDAEDERY